MKFIPILFVVLLFSLGIVSAATCNSTSDNLINSTSITDGCEISTSGDYLMQTNIYSLNGSFNGAIRIVASNVKLDCNYSLLYGNSTLHKANDLNGISVINVTNVTVKNCNLMLYDRAIFIRGSNDTTINKVNSSHVYMGVKVDTGAINTTILNSFFMNDTYALYLTGIKNLTMKDSRMTAMNATRFITGSDVNYFLVDNNSFYNSSTTSNSIDFLNNSIWQNNYFESARSLFEVYTSIDNFDFHNNYAYNVTGRPSAFGFVIRITNFTNGNIYDNNFNLNDVGVFGVNFGNTLNINNNTFLNSYGDDDDYDASIVFQGVRTLSSGDRNFTNINITNNIFTDFGCAGIAARDMFYLRVTGNSFTQNYANLLTKKFECSNEPFTGILISELYKGFIPTGTISWENYAWAHNHTSDYIVISGNSFNNINVPLRTQGAYHVTHDLTNVWTRSFSLPYLSDTNYFWISNDFTNLTNIYGVGHLNNTMKEGINGNWSLMYRFDKNGADYFMNIRTASTALMDFNMTWNGANEAKIDISNSSSMGFSGDYFILLTPGEFFFLFDNFGTVNIVKSQFCSKVTSGYDNFFVSIAVIFSILGIALIIGVLMIVVKVVNEGEGSSENVNSDFIEDLFEKFDIKIVMFSILAIVIIVWVTFIIFSSLC